MTINSDRPPAAGPVRKTSDPVHKTSDPVDKTSDPVDDEQLPSIAEQVADQLGGWRGLAESSVPVVVFVIANVVFSVRPAVFTAVGVAVLIGIVRLAQRRPVRHAINGLFGIAIGAFLALRSGKAEDFYLPGIWWGYGYATVLLGSALVRQPVVGWIWSVLVAGGRSEWRRDPRLVRTFTWLTLLWAVVWYAKVAAQHALWAAGKEHLLGVARLTLGYPPYLVLLLITIWTVRRVTRTTRAAAAF